MKPLQMKMFAVCLGATALAAVPAVWGAEAPTATTRPAATAPNIVETEPADAPIPKGTAGKLEPRFGQLHDSFLRRGWEAPIGVLFLGDSITEGWGRAREVWHDHYFKYTPADFGISGDRTQHVIWRIENKELDHVQPKVVVLMIGTNNIGYPAEEITKGDEKIVELIHQKLPESKLLLLGIFPRGADPKDAKVAGMREKIKAVNAQLAKLDDGKTTRYLDIGDKFLDAEGNLPKDVMPDALHPNQKGYEIWADAMQPLLDEMMK